MTVLSKMNSEEEGRSFFKSIVSLRIMLSLMDREEETIGNMAMLKQILSPGVPRGMQELDMMEEISEEDSSVESDESDEEENVLVVNSDVKAKDDG